MNIRKIKIIGAGSIGNHFANAGIKLGWDVSIFDIDNTDYNGSSPGSIISLEASYAIANDLKLTIGYTDIKGDKKHPQGEDYRLHIMEDFSHIRADIKYSF